MKLFLKSSYIKKETWEKTRAVYEKLADTEGFECYVGKEENEVVFDGKKAIASPEICDIVVSVGGDGTFLNAFHDAFMYDKPIVGINTGNLGFLCAIDFADIDKITKDTFNNLVITKKHLIKIDADKEYYALNDVVLAKNYDSKIKVFTISKDMLDIVSYRADGVIISTPTGSTAYNLSAGGPVLTENTNSIVITPLNPNLSPIRSIVTDIDTPVTIKINGTNSGLSLCVDGIPVNIPDKIVVSKVEKTLKVLTNKNISPIFKIIKK